MVGEIELNSAKIIITNIVLVCDYAPHETQPAVVSTRFLLRAFRSSPLQLALDQQALPECALCVLLVAI